MAVTADSAGACAALAGQHLERGEPLLAYNELQEGLQRWPRHARLRQLQGLALARSGDVARANEVLGELAGDGASDPETLGMLARTHKDLALAAAGQTQRAHLESALSLYEGAYHTARSEGAAAAAWYAGINAATTALLLGKIERAREIAAEVRDICLAHAGVDYWREATLGEAALILGEPQRAAAHYAGARALAKGRYGI
jgi:tetratricopeptide (TPR) repeat protein